MANEKIYCDPQLGDIVFRKRKGIRNLSIRVHPVRGVSVTVPFLVPFSAAMAFFRLKREWVVRSVEEQKSKYGDVGCADRQQVEMMRAEAKRELPGRLAELAARYGFVYNRVAIKHNSSNWGSCSSKDNINLNLNMVRLPLCLRDYIMLHELSHLRHRNHGAEFHSLLESLLADHTRRMAEDGDETACRMCRLAEGSRAKYPFGHIFTIEIKKHRLI